MMIGELDGQVHVHPFHGVDDFGDEFIVSAFADTQSVLAIHNIQITRARIAYLERLDQEQA